MRHLILFAATASTLAACCEAKSPPRHPTDGEAVRQRASRGPDRPSPHRGRASGPCPEPRHPHRLSVRQWRAAVGRFRQSPRDGDRPQLVTARLSTCSRNAPPTASGTRPAPMNCVARAFWRPGAPTVASRRIVARSTSLPDPASNRRSARCGSGWRFSRRSRLCEAGRRGRRRCGPRHRRQSPRRHPAVARG